MKVLVFGLVCIVWVQKACSTPKRSNDSASSDDLLGYESGFCWMDCDWYDDPLYYSHLDLDPVLDYGDGWGDPGPASDDDGGGFEDPHGTYLDTGSGASGRNGGFSSDPAGNGTCVQDDDGIPDPAPPPDFRGDDSDKDKELLMKEDATGPPPWKRLLLGLVAGTVLVKILWKRVIDFVDGALEIPTDAGMERPPVVIEEEPEEVKVVIRKRRPDCWNPAEVVDLGSELFRHQSRFFLLLVHRHQMAVPVDFRRERTLAVHIAPNPVLLNLEESTAEEILMEWTVKWLKGTADRERRRSNPQLEGISAAADRNAVIIALPTPPVVLKSGELSILPPTHLPSLEQPDDREAARHDEVTAQESIPPPKAAAAASVGIAPPPVDKEQLESAGGILFVPSAATIPSSSATEGQPSSCPESSNFPAAISSAAPQGKSSPSQENNPKGIPPPDTGRKHHRPLLENSSVADHSGKVQDKGEDPVAEDRRSQRTNWGFGCLKIPGTSSGVKSSGPSGSDRSKTCWTSKMIPCCLRPQKDRAEELRRKKATKKNKHWMIKLFKFKCC